MLVVANWKMHGDRGFVSRFAAAWTAPSGVEVVVCPPWGYLHQAASAFAGKSVALGAQSTAVASSGPFTGENAAEMAVDLGAAFAIVGHSERRQHFGETNDVVAAKFGAARRAGLTPILCVGETSDERRRGDAQAVVGAQLRAVAALRPNGLGDAVIAYEPVWAIGTGETATPAQAQAMHAAIRQLLPASGRATRLLYGGSVKAANAAPLFAEPDIDGALVGGASLDAGEFAAICFAASATQVAHPAGRT